MERLTNLISIFENLALDFSKNRADGTDLLGDAYDDEVEQLAGKVAGHLKKMGVQA